MCGPTNLDWGTICQNLLGVRPPAIALDYDNLKITWVHNTFSNLVGCQFGNNSTVCKGIHVLDFGFTIWKAKVNCTAAFPNC